MAQSGSHCVHPGHTCLCVASGFSDTDLDITQSHLFVCRSDFLRAISDFKSIPTVSATGIASNMVVLEDPDAR